jgi:hypothetical protein
MMQRNRLKQTIGERGFGNRIAAGLRLMNDGANSRAAARAVGLKSHKDLAQRASELGLNALTTQASRLRGGKPPFVRRRRPGVACERRGLTVRLGVRRRGPAGSEPRNDRNQSGGTSV